MAFRLALVGAGRMGATHARALASSRAVDVACVVDPSDAAAAGVGAPRAALDNLPDVDGALVCVPTQFHLEVVRQLASLGLPVLCEKPCGLTSEETRAIAALGGRLQVAYWRRFVPSLRELRDRIRNGDLGEVVFAACAQLDELPPARAFRNPSSSGGIVVDMGVHELDQLRWLTGREIASVAGVSGAVGWDKPVPGDPPGEVCRIEVIGLNDAAAFSFVAPPDGDETIAAALRAQAEDFARGGGEGATIEDALAALGGAERAKAALKLP